MLIKLNLKIWIHLWNLHGNKYACKFQAHALLENLEKGPGTVLNGVVAKKKCSVKYKRELNYMLKQLAGVQLLYLSKNESSTWGTVKHCISESDHDIDNNNLILKLYISYLYTFEKHTLHFGSCAGKIDICHMILFMLFRNVL